MKSLNGMSNKDIEPVPFPGELVWGADKAASSLNLIRDHVLKRAEAALSWYGEKRGKKRFGAWVLRGGAMLLIGAGGLAPLFGEYLEKDGKPGLDPVIGSIMIGVAALFTLLDRFMGMSSGWMRYMKANQKITKAIEAFRFDFEAAKLQWTSGLPNEEQMNSGLILCQCLVVEVAEIVQAETDQWVVEFKSVLQEIESETKKSQILENTGGLNITITNADELDGEWELQVDESNNTQSGRGRTQGLVNLTPGIHLVTLEGKKGSKIVRASGSVVVNLGKIESLSLTLG